MVLNLRDSKYIYKVRGNLGQIDLTRIDDIVIYEYIHESYDTIKMISSMLNIEFTDLEDYAVERCMINIATYLSYRNSVKLADRASGTEPQSSAIQISYDLKDAKACLSRLFGCIITDDLIPNIASMNTLPTYGTLSTSMI